jgi:lipopolysaccharide biosynthesis regulator YciM
MEDWLMYTIILAAIAIGWWLGSRDHVFRGTKNPFKLPASPQEELNSSNDYLRGINYLLNEQPDRAISTFIDSLDVNQNTIETHLALGSLLRRRGEVDKAVTVHQNLLERTQLQRDVWLEVQLELVRDYLLAGLLDRAESLLQKLIQEGGEVRLTGLNLLIEIYQQERDWQKAIDTVSELRELGSFDNPVTVAHFHCELADIALQNRDLPTARLQAQAALSEDPNCVRASLTLAAIDCREHEFDSAILTLQRIREQDASLVPLSLELLLRAYEESGQDQQQYRDYLTLCLEDAAAISIVLALAVSIRQELGDIAVSRFISGHLKKHPTIRGLTHLIDMHMDNTSGIARENLSILKSFTEALVADKPAYRCEECGFSGKKMHWLCPSCKQWGTVEPIYGLEGE